MTTIKSKAKKWTTAIHDLPAKPGIYIICSEKENLASAVYVGQSNNIKRRLNNNHPAYRKALAEFGTVYMNWEIVPDENSRNYRESFLIGSLEPEYNFGGSRTITDKHGFLSDNWQILTHEFITNLNDVSTESVELCYSWLEQTWEYKQHAILFEYLNYDENFKVLQNLKHLAISIASRQHTKKCDYNQFYNRVIDSELSAVVENFQRPEHIKHLYTKELQSYTQSIKPFFIFGEIRDWIYSHQIDNAIECLLLLQGLNLPNIKQLVSNTTNKKVLHFLNKNLIDWDFSVFIKEGYAWLKQRHQEIDNFENELKSCNAEIMPNIMTTKEVWERDTPYDFWHQVLFWSLIKNEPYILLPHYLLDDWYNYNVLEYVYRNKHEVEYYYNSRYISSKDFVAAFYSWCLGNNKIPEINFKNHCDDEKMAQARVRIGKS